MARKKIIGVVTSASMQRSRTVRVDYLYMHPKYRKIMRRNTKFICHDHVRVCAAVCVCVSMFAVVTDTPPPCNYRCPHPHPILGTHVMDGTA